MVAKTIMLFTSKLWIVINVLMYGLILIYFIKIIISEVEEFLSIFFQPDSFRYEEISKRYKLKWMDNADANIPFKPTNFFTG